MCLSCQITMIFVLFVSMLCIVALEKTQEVVIAQTVTFNYYTWLLNWSNFCIEFFSSF